MDSSINGSKMSTMSSDDNLGMNDEEEELSSSHTSPEPEDCSRPKKRRKQSNPTKYGSSSSMDNATTFSPQPVRDFSSVKDIPTSQSRNGQEHGSESPQNSILSDGHHSRSPSSHSSSESETFRNFNGMLRSPMDMDLPLLPNPFMLLQHTSSNYSAGQLPMQSRGPMTMGGGGFRIFNPEAYCELCEKEFCNKYFLKTHKANKHGIYCPDMPSSFPNSVPSYSCSSLPNSAAAQMQQMLQQAAGATGSGGSEAAQAAAAMVARGLGMVNLESFCEICQKEFCNKYFLRKHKQKIHGINDGSSSGRQASGSGSPNSNSEGGEPQSQRVSESPSSPRMTLVSPPATPDKNNSEVSCEVCKQEFSNQLQLQAHKLTSHGIAPSSRPTPTLSPIAQLQTMAALQVEALAGNTIRTIAIPESSFSPDRPRNESNSIVQNSSLERLERAERAVVASAAAAEAQRNRENAENDKLRNVTGRNYCNICNKELCNKYFMKTHMLKMHGINIDEHPAEAAVTSTIGGVTCDICQKELCSKYFLKVHKQNTHGYVEEPSSSTKETKSNHHNSSHHSAEKEDKEHMVIQGIDPSDTTNRYFNHYTEICPLCERRFKSVKWRDTHIRNDHMDQAMNSRVSDSKSESSRSHKPPKVSNEVHQGHESRTIEEPRQSPNSLSQQLAIAFQPSGPSLGSSSFLMQPFLNSTPSQLDGEFLERRFKNRFKWFKHQMGLSGELPPDLGQRTPKTDGQKPETKTNGSSSVKNEVQGQPVASSERSNSSGDGAKSPNAQLPVAYAIPQTPTSGAFIMQPFLITPPSEAEADRVRDNFVPSLVYLPVSKKVMEPVTVAFQLTPA